MTYKIRPWRPDDEAASGEAFRAAYMPIINECPDDYRPVIEEILERSVARSFVGMPDFFQDKDRLAVSVVELDEKLVGYVDVWFTAADTAYIGNIFVVPEARRQGIAFSLMDRAEAHAIEHGAREMTLKSGHALVEAHTMYLRRGYRLTGTVAMQPRREITMLQFAKTLNSS